MSSTTLCLIVPDLIDPVAFLKELPAQDLPELPVFSRFLSRGKHVNPDSLDYSNNNLYSCLLKQFSLQNHFSELPVTSLSYFFDTKKAVESKTKHNFPSLVDLNNKWLMRVDPCFMVADRDQLVLAKTGNLDISLQEAELLVKDINHFYDQFDDDKFWTLKAVSPERWYLISDKPIKIQTIPPEKVIGQSLKSYLFSGNTNDNKYWLNLFNEFQMILHQSKINKQRQENNKLPVNSVWFWGADNGAELLNSFFIKGDALTSAKVYTNNTIAQGLTLINQGSYYQVPEVYKSVTSDAGQHSVYIIDDFSRAIQNKDVFQWVGLLERFEKNYLIPLLDDINAGNIAQLELISPTGKKLLVTKKLLKCWWRKNKNFEYFF